MLNAGFTCPNRDGSKGTGGCTYCNNQTFSPDYCYSGKSISEQLKEGIAFFASKYPEMKYLAYFQAYTNTYGSLEMLMQLYHEALCFPGVVGLIIGTRPDCMPDALLERLSMLAKSCFVLIEYGVETTNNQTLQAINRGHTYEEAVSAIHRTASYGLMCGIHLILGLPEEDDTTILSHAEKTALLPLTTIKLHQLQIIRNTPMAEEYRLHPERFHLLEMDKYIDLCIDFLERSNPAFVFERFVSQSPRSLLVAPDWDVKNYEFIACLNRRITERKTFQGRFFAVASSSN